MNGLAAYKLGVFRDRSKHVDFNWPLKEYELLYNIVGPVALLVLRMF